MSHVEQHFENRRGSHRAPATAVSRRWLVVAAATIGMAAAYGGISTVGVLVEPFQAEFGWPKADISSGYVLLTLGAAFGGILAGRLADRFSTGPIALAGILFIGTGMMIIALQSSMLGMQVVYLVMGFLGFACLYSPLLTTVSLWFPTGHGLPLGIVTAGGAVGQAVVPPLFQNLVLALGWRDASVALGVGFLVTLAPFMMLIRKPSAAAGAAGAPLSGAAATWPLPPALSTALLGLAALLCCGLMGVPSVHLVSTSISAGLDPQAAAMVVTVAMLSGCVGRLATGMLIDRIGSLGAYALVSLIQTAGVYAFVHAGSEMGLLAVAAFYGLGFGGVMTALVCAVREAVPARSVGSAMAMVGLLAWLGMGAGGYQGGLCFDLTGSYELSFTLAALSGLGNLATIAATALLVRRGRRGNREPGAA